MGCPHFCADELMAILAVLGGIRYIPSWVRMMWAKRHQKPVCRHDHEHKE